ncbi:MAG: bis(5'-nucleosyl)-tetraphosphatase (symmetrical) YqeK [Leptolyngbyaceae cyanobacterium bins.302]|nr:bis(5'-nucleosyl)-tetraphosphatase (symmetrical) YqeK [Leptolyngbyaceae cyanobacterium bins.302]
MSDAKHPQAACERDNQAFPIASASEPYHEEFFDRPRVLTWLEANVPPKRLHHILRVEEMAVALANHHRLDVSRAAQAGLMHDLAKCFKPKHLLQLAWEHSIPIDSVFEANPHLLHADVGAIVARNEFGIQDEEVLAAIRNHTLGSAGMSSLSCVVFLADTLEPGRGDSSELQALRQVCWQDLHQAVWLTSEYTLRYLFESKSLIHPRALLTRNWAMQVVMNVSKAS